MKVPICSTSRAYAPGMGYEVQVGQVIVGRLRLELPPMAAAVSVLRVDPPKDLAALHPFRERHVPLMLPPHRLHDGIDVSLILTFRHRGSR